MTLQGNYSKGEAAVTVTISLSEKGDLLRLQSSGVDESVEQRCRLLGVPGAVIDDVAVRRIVSQDRTAREGSKKQGLIFVGQWHGDDCIGGADVAYDGDNVILFDQLPH